MSLQPQAGVCAEGNLHAIYLFYSLKADSSVRQALARLAQQLPEFTKNWPDAHFSSVIAIGSEAWDRLFPERRPSLLQPFPSFDQAQYAAPVTPRDLFIQLRGDQFDILHLAAQQVATELADSAELVEETMGFRYLDNRDLTGFVDGTENPEGENRAAVALVGGSDPEFAGGSYIHVQRYQHKMPDWERISVKQQEDIIGRTKADNIEYASADKPLTAHIKRVNLKDAQGNSKEILRQSMPWGTSQQQGLMFISCCETPANFTDQLESMLVGDGQGHTDHLMKYTQAMTGAAFFAPSVGFLTNN